MERLEPALFMFICIILSQLNLQCNLWWSIIYSFNCSPIKKVKASHTHYWALGMERIPVYRQSVCGWL